MKDDLISRQAAIETVKKHYRGFDNDLLEVIAYEMERLPSAQLAQDLPNGCTDTISRAAALNLIEQSCCDLEYACDNVALRKEVEALPSAQPEQRWIPCSKKLPELNRSVLVQLSDDFVDPIQIMTLNISKCEGDFFYFWETQEMGINFEMGDVVAWQPLPLPWKWEQDG